MTTEQLEKYKKWVEYGTKTLIVICVGCIIPLLTHYVEAQSIHSNHSKDIKSLKEDVKKTVIIPSSIKMNAYKINQCNKAIDEVKKDFKEFKIEQKKQMEKIIDLLIDIKTNGR